MAGHKDLAKVPGLDVTACTTEAFGRKVKAVREVGCGELLMNLRNISISLQTVAGKGVRKSSIRKSPGRHVGLWQCVNESSGQK